MLGRIQQQRQLGGGQRRRGDDLHLLRILRHRLLGLLLHVSAALISLRLGLQLQR